MKVKLPNFLLVGAAKSGTTSLYHYLGQHPDIYMPRNKEPHFLVSSILKNINPEDPRYKVVRKDVIFTFEDYVKLFEDIKNEKAIGEASVTYLYYHETAIQKIKTYLGNIKIMIILRNPVYRAFSAYTRLLMNYDNIMSFERCLEFEEERKKENWCMLNFYKDVGFYYKQVKAFIENFSDVKVFLYDDFKKDALALAKDMYRFLKVDDAFIPDIGNRYNVSGVPKNTFLHDFLTKPNVIRRMIKAILRIMLPEDRIVNIGNKLVVKNLTQPEMKPETKEYLKNLYKEDILKLQDLISRDLSHWLR